MGEANPSFVVEAWRGPLDLYLGILHRQIEKFRILLLREFDFEHHFESQTRPTCYNY